MNASKLSQVTLVLVFVSLLAAVGGTCWTVLDSSPPVANGPSSPKEQEAEMLRGSRVDAAFGSR